MPFLESALGWLKDFAPLISAAVLLLSVRVALSGLRLSAIINIAQKRGDYILDIATHAPRYDSRQAYDFH